MKKQAAHRNTEFTMQLNDIESSRPIASRKAIIKKVIRNGVCIVSSARFHTGNIIESTFDFDNRAPGRMTAFCRVQSSSRINPGLYETGLDFIIIEKKDYINLHSYASA